MTRTFYFVGGEDFDFTGYGNVEVDTDPTHRNPLMSRCSLRADDSFSGWGTGDVGDLTTAWFHAIVWAEKEDLAIPFSNLTGDGREFRRGMLRFLDANGVIRLMIGYTTTANFASFDPFHPVYWWLAKADEAGEVTYIGARFSAWVSANTTTPNAIDINISNYDVEDGGSVRVWVNNTLAFAVYDTTLFTDGNDSINEWRLSGLGSGIEFDTNKVSLSYSQVAIGAEDTRGLSIATLVPSGLGNLDNWATGTFSDINEVTLDDSTTNTSDAPGQIQQYKVTGPLSGSYGVVGVVVSVRAQKGFLGGPTQLDLGVRTGGSDYWGSDLTLPVSKQHLETFFMLNPDTGDAWTIAELSAPDFNIGMKSVA